jgi:2-polyprenyl-3-methyl-5-hydroxy-6-metoxy-1,4-benzoquinol methylase
MPIWFIQAISYIWPVTIRQYESKFSGHLFIRYFMGKKVLDTRMTNYSFGGLQKVLKRSLELLPFQPNAENILILGFGAGSVLETIRKQHHSKAQITGIDIDEMVFTIAKEEFNIEEGSDTRFIVADAINWIKNQQEIFDLIIVDLFIIDTLPPAATEYFFIEHLVKALKSEGQLIFNTIPETLPVEELETMIYQFEKLGVGVRKMKKWGYSNNIILGNKSGVSVTQPVE